MSLVKKTIMIEEVPAWMECDVCKGTGGGNNEPCSNCQGAGGEWHEAVDVSKVGWYIERSSLLTRKHDVCKRCGGECLDLGDICGCNGTGAEPDTAGEWRVR